MCTTKAAFALLCVFLVTLRVGAVVNNAQVTTNADGEASENAKNGASGVPADSVAVASEQDANRRDAPVGLSDTYGVPALDSYVPNQPSNLGLPVPVYGAPDASVVFPAPPPDVPPPLPSLPPVTGTYGPPKPVYGLPPSFGGHNLHHKPHSKPFFLPTTLKLPKPSFGPSAPIFAPKPHYGPPHKLHHGPPKIPKPFGPPLKLNFLNKPHFGHSKPIYGLPKINGPIYKPVLGHSLPGPVFLPNKDIHGSILHGPQKSQYAPPAVQYGPPAIQYGPPAIQYGPPDPVPHGPPHPGVPAPPTPPDIKYDGWQPIPGLVSRPLSDTYGVPNQGIATGTDLHFNNDFVPPPVGGNADSGIFLTYASQFAHGNPSDSYGAPLNSVTGSGGIASSAVQNHNIGFGDDLSVIKSIGYELFPGGHASDSQVNVGITDSYSSPPADSYAPDGPYPAAKPHKGKGVSFHGHHGNGFKSHIGLIPPSGIYGVPPGGKYGTSFFKPPKSVFLPGNTYGPPASLHINPPKSPVFFREPVPAGLIESIGDSVVHKDAHGIEHSQTKFHGTAYIPPPVPDITKSKDFIAPTPSNLYTLPSTGNPVSFQSVVQGASTVDVGTDVVTSFGLGTGTGAGFTSYTAPLGAIDSSYGVPAQSAPLIGGIDLATNFGTLSNTYAVPISFHSNVPHDCSQHKSQSVSFGLPTLPSTTYTTSLSSLNTNIGGQAQYQPPPVTYGTPDLQSAFSVATTNVQGDLNAVDIQGKALKDAEFQKSHEIQIPNGVQNIPVQGALGSYTLQIQSAGGAPGDNIPHDQVLSEGLLQSILSAIEQPQQQQGEYVLRPGLEQLFVPQPDGSHGYADQHHSSSLVVVKDGAVDGEAQHSVTREVVVTAPVTEATTTVERTTTAPGADQLNLIDNNEIALYFNVNGVEDGQVKPAEGGKGDSEADTQEVRNGQQYGSFVSFQTPHSSYVYGEVKPQNGTQVSVSSE